MRGYISRDSWPLAGQPLEIDTRSSLYRGLTALWVFDEPFILRERFRNIITAGGSNIKTGVALAGGGADNQSNQRIGAANSSKLSGPTISNAMLGIANQMSLVGLLRSTTTTKMAFCRPAAATHTSPFADFGLFTDGLFRMSTAGSSVTPNSGFALTSGGWYLASLTYDGTTASSQVGYAAPGIAALSGNVRDGGQEFIFGGSRSATEDYVGDQVYIGIWNRALEQGERRHLVSNPLAFLKPAPRTYFIPQPHADIDLGLATEGDAALALRTDVPIGLALEADTALSLRPVRSLAIGLAAEIDTALSVTALRTLGLPEETDSALFVLPSLGLAREADEALSLRAVRTYALGLTEETDEALSLTALMGEVFALGLATETDTALSAVLQRLGFPTETDEALPILPLQVPHWPFDDLKPRHIGIYPCAAPIGGGSGIAGREPTVDSGAGYWRIEYGGVPVKDRAKIRLWRAMETTFEGRGRAVLIYLFDGKRAPWPGTPGGSLPAFADGAVAAGATQITIDATGLAALAAGMHFSAGHYAYRIEDISSAIGDIYTCTIWPKTREAISDGAALEFGRPILRVRLEDDDGMALPLDLLKHGDGNVVFVEDVP